MSCLWAATCQMFSRYREFKDVYVGYMSIYMAFLSNDGYPGWSTRLGFHRYCTETSDCWGSKKHPPESSNPKQSTLHPFHTLTQLLCPFRTIVLSPLYNCSALSFIKVFSNPFSTLIQPRSLTTELLRWQRRIHNSAIRRHGEPSNTGPIKRLEEGSIEYSLKNKVV